MEGSFQVGCCLALLLLSGRGAFVPALLLFGVLRFAFAFFGGGINLLLYLVRFFRVISAIAVVVVLSHVGFSIEHTPRDDKIGVLVFSRGVWY